MHETKTIRSPIQNQIGADQTDCPECECTVTVPHGFGQEVVACPKCGQCVSATGSIGVTNWGLIRPHWPLSHKKYPPGMCLTFGVIVGASAFVPFFAIYAKAAAALVGIGLLLEGLGRWLDSDRAESPFQQGHVSPELSTDQRLGSLKAIFNSRASIIDSLVLCCMAGTFLSASMWAIGSLVTDGVGGYWVKLTLCAIVAPAAFVYIIYRAIRFHVDRQSVYIHHHGLRWFRGGRERTALWVDVKRLTAVHLGDAIDEDAIILEFHTPLPDQRFTRGSFDLFATMWQRIYQEADEQISSHLIQIRVCTSAVQLKS